MPPGIGVRNAGGISQGNLPMATGLPIAKLRACGTRVESLRPQPSISTMKDFFGSLFVWYNFNMKITPKLILANAVFLTVIGITTAIVCRSSKLYFSGDGGGTDTIIVLKMMFGASLLSCAALGVYAYFRNGYRRALSIATQCFIVGLFAVLIIGSLITRFAFHSACDEYGLASAACMDEKSQWSPFY